LCFILGQRDTFFDEAFSVLDGLHLELDKLPVPSRQHRDSVGETGMPRVVVIFFVIAICTLWTRDELVIHVQTLIIVMGVT
jgi:hypothetical protein